MSKKLSMRVATHALIAGLAISSGGIGAVTLASPAMAESSPTSIDTSKTDASITIHKRASDNPADWSTPDGAEITQQNGGERWNKLQNTQELDGATFSVTRVPGYDFKTVENINEASALTVAKAKKLTENVNADQVKPTKDGGIAKFTNLKVGVYLVKEDKAPAGKVAVNPFLVYLPMTNPAGDGWNYDVHAYPKNTEQTLEKKLSDQLPNAETSGNPTEEEKKANIKANAEANVGDTISYDISGEVPVMDKAKSYVKFYQIYDKVPAGLAFESNKTQLKIGDEVLTPGDEYTVDLKKIADASGTLHPYAFYTLTKKGNKKLSDADKGTPVVGTFTFTIEKLGDKKKGLTTANKGGVILQLGDRTPDGEIPTDPNVYPDPDPDNPPSKPDPDDPNNPETPTVIDSWAKIEFKKTREDGTTALEGAEFNIYRCSKPGGDPEGFDTKDKKADLQEKILTKQGAQGNGVFISDAEGKVTINGVRIRKNTVLDNNKQEVTVRGNDGGYCIVESKAPEGFELLPSPYFFRLAEDAAERDEEFTFDSPIENRKSVGPKLPATGGMGVGILAAVGALIVGAGVFFARRNSKARG